MVHSSILAGFAGRSALVSILESCSVLGYICLWLTVEFEVMGRELVGWFVGTCGASSASQLRLQQRCRFLGWSGKCAQTYRIWTRTRQQTATTQRITEGTVTEVRRHTDARS